ncbi:hypothetical protein B0H13DRAFT_2073693, partial [Mycena leptocephala]
QSGSSIPHVCPSRVVALRYSSSLKTLKFQGHLKFQGLKVQDLSTCFKSFLLQPIHHLRAHPLFLPTGVSTTAPCKAPIRTPTLLSIPRCVVVHMAELTLQCCRRASSVPFLPVLRRPTQSGQAVGTIPVRPCVKATYCDLTLPQGSVRPHLFQVGQARRPSTESRRVLQDQLGRSHGASRLEDHRRRHSCCPGLAPRCPIVVVLEPTPDDFNR